MDHGFSSRLAKPLLCLKYIGEWLSILFCLALHKGQLSLSDTNQALQNSAGLQRITANPKVIPKKCGSVRIGDDSPEIRVVLSYQMLDALACEMAL
jgi:hypothetical protein